MPNYRITSPDGKTFNINAPEGATKEDALAYFQSNYKPEEKPMTWGEAATSGLKRFPESAGNMISGAVETIAHPIDTATTLKDIAVGAISKDATPEQKAIANAAGDFYKDRYGSVEGFKKAIATDPAGVLSDVSTIATGGGALMSKVPQLAKAGSVVSKIGAVTNPLALPQATISKTAGAIAPAFGVSTGTGETTIQKAYEAGKAGDEKLKAFVSHLRGDSDLSEIVPEAQQGVKNIRAENAAEYNAGMDVLRQDKTPLNVVPIEQAINNALSIKKYEGFDKNPELQKTRNGIVQALKEFKSAQIPTDLQRLQGIPQRNDLNTIAGFDALKQRINTMADYLEPRTDETRMVSSVANAIKDEIAKQSDEYANIMAKYGEKAKMADDIEKTLSLSPKASPDTALRKLQSLTRNNVATNYGNRLSLAQQLEQHGAPELITKIAGQALSSKTPRGLQTMASIPETLFAFSQGGIAPALLTAAATSPRLVGEGAVLAGKAARLGENLLPSNIDPKLLANYLYQAQQPKGE